MTIYYVFQSKTYDIEYAGEYLWSPQLTKNGMNNSGFLKMTEIITGDYILHHNKGRIVAISRVEKNCYEADQPTELSQGETAELWNKEGYRIDSTYYQLDHSLQLSSIREWLINNYKPDSAFTVAGKGKQRYMCELTKEHADYILKEIYKNQFNDEVLFHIKSALNKI